ncbi:MAG: fibronectin type III domain-containing protein, partial [Candidatus Thermoplasmatota archaeon]
NLSDDTDWYKFYSEGTVNIFVKPEKGLDISVFIYNATQSMLLWENPDIGEGCEINYTTKELLYIKINRDRKEGNYSLNLKILKKINEPPKALVASIDAINETAIKIKWGKSDDENFDRYVVMRALIQPVTEYSGIIHMIYDRNITEFIDENVTSGRTYYYRIYVYDKENEKNWSNEVSITTPNTPPKKVDIGYENVTNSSVIIKWTMNNEKDFYAYELYISESANNWVLVEHTHDANKRKYEVMNLSSGKTYYFKVRVVDEGNLTTDSDIVVVKTIAERKKPHEIEKQTTFIIIGVIVVVLLGLGIFYYVYQYR